ncbi:MAG: hypothetical protein JNJ65_05230 [Cyclobacteriaceae bacterium]|nr:hypothetical protein [Cyclobacteriaceae bacterium]
MNFEIKYRLINVSEIILSIVAVLFTWHALVNGLFRILVKELVSLTNLTAMTKVSLEYHYDLNSLRTNETTVIEEGWRVVDYCDKDLADSFVQKMNSVLESDPLLSFKNIDNLKFLLKDHMGQFLVVEKKKENSTTDKNSKILYI